MSTFSELQTAFFQKHFDAFDKDKVGRIPTSEVPFLVRVCGATPLEAELDLLVSTADPDKRGSCNFDGFCAALQLAFEHCVTAQDAKEAFIAFDTQQKGFIAPHELRYFLTTLGDALTVEEANDFMNAMMSEVDSEGNIIFLDAIEKMTPQMYRQ